MFPGLYFQFLLPGYRPPSQNVLLFLAELEQELKRFRSKGHFCPVGGFNIGTQSLAILVVCDYLNLLPKYGIEKNLLPKYEIKNTITLPTREKLPGKLVVSCIDPINVRAPNITVRSAAMARSYQIAT